MAWSAPRTWVASELVTDTIMNTHVRDNLNYLKGNAGTVAIASGMSVAGLLTATLGGASENIVSALSGSTGNYAAMSVGRAVPEAEIGVAAGAGNFFTGVSAAGDAVVRVSDAAKNLYLGAGANGTAETMTIRAATLDQIARIAGVGGGFLFLSAGAVNNTLRTPVAAGTVANGAVFYIVDRNNTGGAVVLATTGVLVNVGSSNAYVNNDTITYAVTAGGAITLQRTTGSNGTHDVTALVLYH